MSYIDENLIFEERVLYRTRLHWIVMTRPIIVAALSGIAGIALLMGSLAKLHDQNTSTGSMAIGGFVLVLVAVASVGWGIWNRTSTEMAVTNKRILVKTGLVSRNTTEMILGKIESVTVNQSVTGRILNFGTIVVRGTGGTPESFGRIARPLEFRRQIQQQLDSMQTRSIAATTEL